MLSVLSVLSVETQRILHRARGPATGSKATSHSLRVGPNTDLAGALVPLSERSTAGGWSADSILANDVYSRPVSTIDTSKSGPLDAVPLWSLSAEPGRAD
ncbi:hypothetical protein OG478_13755 [Streptomyces phaeochromogenes]|uniref:hypothetical protein n=1 Tax=Streptomyces phaeochromogenes TaxID=1923 RepID=UPI00386D6F2F|nr:hypothetical protein OG478_13755 [Streptomyces phaeochromogenes]